MYEVNAISVLEAFEAFVQGTPEATVLVASAAPASTEARTAIESSARQLGFGPGACAWLTIAADGMSLGPQEVGTVAEGIDPLSVVCLDAESSSLFGQAYRAELPLNEASRVKGRTVAAFESFDGLLADEAGKQRAWALLKRLCVA